MCEQVLQIFHESKIEICSSLHLCRTGFAWQYLSNTIPANCWKSEEERGDNNKTNLEVECEYRQ